MPGLYDSHVHPLDAATSEAAGPLPNLRSLKDVFTYIRKRAAVTPKGEWIVVRYAFPTRLDEARFPTKAELDEAAPQHPVLFHAGPAGVVNSLGLKVSDITRDTPNPPAGVVAKDATTGEPTGMLRNAFHLLKGLPRDAARLSSQVKREAAEGTLRPVQRARVDQHRRPQRRPCDARPVPQPARARRTDGAVNVAAASTRPARARRSRAAWTNCRARTASAARPASATIGCASARSNYFSMAAC